LIGKKVAFGYNAWGTHSVKNEEKELVLFLDDSVDLAKAANAIVNPLTVCALVDAAKKLNTKAVISLAASSQLSKQLYKLGKKEGIEVIGIVRKDKQI
jgi:NADPH:quinone reductase-like Zn-dependent oxidoreductase